MGSQHAYTEREADEARHEIEDEPEVQLPEGVDEEYEHPGVDWIGPVP